MNCYMRDLILLTSFILPFLLSCKQGGQEVADFDDEMPKFPDQRFDSLMWLQYHCPDDEEKTAYEWNWAVQWYMDFTIDYETSTQVPED